MYPYESTFLARKKSGFVQFFISKNFRLLKNNLKRTTFSGGSFVVAVDMNHDLILRSGCPCLLRFESLPLMIFATTPTSYGISIRAIFKSMACQVRFANVIFTAVPTPSVLSMVIFAPYLAAMCFTMARPSPVPPVFLERDLSTR